MSTKKLKLFLLLFLQSAVVAFAQQDLRSGVTPDVWYSEDTHDAAYESTLKQLQRTWVFVSGDFDGSFPKPTTKFSFNGKLKSVTFKPNGLGSIAFNRESYLVEIPFTYTKKKDKITISINYLRAKVSSTISKEELNNLSQRRKDNIERTRNEYLVDARKNGTCKRTFTMYRIDDYLVLYGKFYGEFGSLTEETLFISKEVKRPWDKRIKEIYAAPNDSTVFTSEAKNFIHEADEAFKFCRGSEFNLEVLPKYEFLPEDEVVYSIYGITDSTATVYLNNVDYDRDRIKIKFAKEDGIWKIKYIDKWNYWNDFIHSYHSKRGARR